MAKLKVHYVSSERDEAKMFLAAQGALLTEAASRFYLRWVTVDGNVWVEYDDLPFYTLFLESPEDAWNEQHA